MMLDNTTFNKIKLVYELSQLIWFVEKHALSDAEKAGDAELLDTLKDLKKELPKYLERLQKDVCTISQ